jgi:uncharacterized membrane protein
MMPQQEQWIEKKEADTWPVNLTSNERWVSIATGAPAILYGLSRRTRGGLGLALGGGYLLYRGLTGHCPAYQAMGINMAERAEGMGIDFEKTVTVNKPAAEVYQFWHNLENLPRFMPHLVQVTPTSPGSRQTHWVAQVPGGVTFEWDAEVTEEQPNELISWRSLPSADIDHRGSVYFKAAPGGRGTEVKVKLEYYPPGGLPGVAVAKLLNRITAEQIKEDLRRFKQIIETGEAATTEGQTRGGTNGSRE